MSKNNNISRRELLKQGAAGLSSGALILGAARSIRAEDNSLPNQLTSAASTTKKVAGTNYTSVVTPNGSTLPYHVVENTKIFHLIAEQIEHEFASGLKAHCWGYNGQVHGPTIEAVEGDHVRIYVTNRLPAPTTVHWHGLFVPNGMDGVSGLTQKPIAPGETFLYEFTLIQHGTFLYHPHYDEMVQMGMGLMGMIVIHPRDAATAAPDRDFALLSSEWKIRPGTTRPDPYEMTDFNILTFNGRCYPGTAPLIVKRGERVRLRLGNLSAMSHHSIHFHGHRFVITATDGGDIPITAQQPETTVIVPVGCTRTVEFMADNLGDWPLHCHMTHHIMNQMGHGLPNMIGVEAKSIDQSAQKLLPGYMTMGQAGMAGMMDMGSPKNSIPMLMAKGPYAEIGMGGMFTLVKIREAITPDTESSWHQPAAGTLATNASEIELKRDGIKL